MNDRCSYGADTDHPCEKEACLAIQEFAGERRLLPFCAPHFIVFAMQFRELIRRAIHEMRETS
jgi:hypothetical protein